MALPTILSRYGVLCVLAAAAGAGCADPAKEVHLQTSYDKSTGKLNRLAADLNKDGRTDTWTTMDGATPIRTEQDMDGDGKVERWEYFRSDGSVERVALSRRNTGKPDMWTWLDAAGQAARIETASQDAAANGQDARVDRWEIYKDGRLDRVEEDTDGDGRVDKWEKHEGPAIVFVEFDHDKDGKPDERISFDSAGKIISRQKIGG
jgi:hypothetical protein